MVCAAPLLLLDEVAAHLDERRRHALFDEIGALGAQAWMTGTEPALFAPLAGHVQHFAVEDGRVTRVLALPSDPDAFEEFWAP